MYFIIEAQYKITGGTIHLNTLYVDSRDYSEGTKRVNYEGVLRLDTYFGITDADQEKINKNIPVKIKTYSNLVEANFSKDEPLFTVSIYPDAKQIDSYTLLRNLYALGSLEIMAPRGLSSIKYLPVLSSRIDIISNAASYTLINSQAPSFEFLSKDIGIKDVTAKIEFKSESNYTITLSGKTLVDSVQCYTTMSKTDNNKDYVISLNGSEGAILTYTSLNNTVLPSMTVNDIDLLPDSEHSQAILKRLSISEKGLHFATPVIKMYFSPYIMYKIQGFHDTNGDGKPD